MINNQQINILNKALPHMPPQVKACAQIIIQAYELSDSVHNMSDGGISACDSTNTMPVNIEQLLRDIRPVCSKKDAQYIDTYLNFLRTKNVLNVYKTMNPDSMPDIEHFAKDLFKNTSYANNGGNQNEQQ